MASMCVYCYAILGVILLLPSPYIKLLSQVNKYLDINHFATSDTQELWEEHYAIRSVLKTAQGTIEKG